MRRAEIDDGLRPGKTTGESTEIKALQQENAELRRAQRNPEERLGFLRGGARPPQQVLIDCITDHKEQFGVEPICRAQATGDPDCPIHLLRGPQPPVVEADPAGGGVDHVELEILSWVYFFNTERLHESLDALTPIAADGLHYAAGTSSSRSG